MKPLSRFIRIIATIGLFIVAAYAFQRTWSPENISRLEENLSKREAVRNDESD